MPIELIITIIAMFVISGLTLLIIFGVGVYRYLKRVRYIKHFKEYVSVLDYHMDKAYDMVHKHDILAYSLDAYRVPDDEYEKISQSFVKLVQKYLGPVLLKEFIQMYGDVDTFIFTCLEYFARRYEEDEIRKSAMDNLTNEDQ